MNLIRMYLNQFLDDLDIMKIIIPSTTATIKIPTQTPALNIPAIAVHDEKIITPHKAIKKLYFFLILLKF
jgi:hypothetical protein